MKPLMQRLATWLLIAALSVWQVGPSFAAVTATPAFVQTPKMVVTTFVQGTDAAGTYKTLYTGGANGSKIVAVILSSTDNGVVHGFVLQASNSTTDHCVTATTCGALSDSSVTLGAGTTPLSPTVNALSGAYAFGLPRDSEGNAYVILTSSSQTLEGTFATAMTAGAKITVTVIGADF